MTSANVSGMSTSTRHFPILRPCGSWHKADKLTELKVRGERRAEVRICHDYPDAGLTSASDNQWRAGQDDQFPSYLYIAGRRAYVFT